MDSIIYWILYYFGSNIKKIFGDMRFYLNIISTTGLKDVGLIVEQPQFK